MRTRSTNRHRQATSEYRRVRITVSGAVQGVGFRPFVYRLARRFGLVGWVCNTTEGVVIEAEGTPASLASFQHSLLDAPPPLAHITGIDTSNTELCGDSRFEVRESRGDGAPTAIVLPDIATCPDCVREIFDPVDRRFQYPFTNCTNCGPRYSIIEALPYDRKLTSMKRFPMCDSCRAEYENPGDRRFHAQPIACPDCGPHIELWGGDGKILGDRATALSAACEQIRRGKMVAVKGLGGFQLMVDARNDVAVRRLRERKAREEKPLAMMFPDIERVSEVCELSSCDSEILTSYRAPIVLLKRCDHTGDNEISSLVAPDNPYLGIMLPYTPLHHLMMAKLEFPVVATSGNLSDEPICIDEHDALNRLHDIADVFLVHNRPIVRQMDDSVVHVVAAEEQVLRHARGYAPTPLKLPTSIMPALAVGGHLKNTVAAASANKAYLSQHIGDLDSALAYDSLDAVSESLLKLYDIKPSIVVHDSHPDYSSTRYARELGVPTIGVQHHYAHILSCMLDNDIEEPVLGAAWDGAGLGDDATIWGGEFLTVDSDGYSRTAHLRHFRLPGGEAAIREPRRAAVGMLFELLGEEIFTLDDNASIKSFSESELRILHRMLASGVQSPVTSSMGRLFDVVASLLGICHINRFEGQAAMQLGFLAEKHRGEDIYSYDINSAVAPKVIDWGPMMLSILDDMSNSCSAESVARKFHNTLCEIIVTVAKISGERRVALSGGCFQNRYLSERAIERLRQEGFEPYRHYRIPPNDGGLAAGQLAALIRDGKGAS